MSIMIRLFFEKADRSKYISHLDITRLFSRAIARTTIPVWYTEGFNPRIYMTFPLPLSLGYEGFHESFEMKLVDDDFPLEQVTEQLNRTLPTGIRILETVLPVLKPDGIALADYRITLESDNPACLADKLSQFVAQPQIIVTKKSKKGERELDILPYVTLQSTEQEGSSLVVVLRLAAGTTLNISPALFIDAFAAFAGVQPLEHSVERHAILTADGTVWR